MGAKGGGSSATVYLGNSVHLAVGLRAQFVGGRLCGQSSRASSEAVAPRPELTSVTRTTVHFAVVFVTVRAVQTPSTGYCNNGITVMHLTHMSQCALNTHVAVMHLTHILQ